SRFQWYPAHLRPRQHWGSNPQKSVSEFYGTEGREFESLRARLKIAANLVPSDLSATRTPGSLLPICYQKLRGPRWSRARESGPEMTTAVAACGGVRA